MNPVNQEAKALTNQPDITEARRFLATLSGQSNETFVFQTFDDRKEVKRPELTKVLIGTLDDHVEELIRLNKFGAGIFVQINNGTARGAANITGLRALFVDQDRGNLEGLKVQPTILVKTKNGCHAYWRLSPGELQTQFKSAQKALIHHLATDPCVHNLDRVMRLPGFFHQKDPANQFMVTVIETNDLIYRISDITNVYSELCFAMPQKGANRAAENGDTLTNRFQDWASDQPTADGQRNSTVVRIVREGLGQNIIRDDLRAVIEKYCTVSGLPIDEGAEILDRHILQHQQTPFEPFIVLGVPTYEFADGKMVWNKPTADGTKQIPLCNFEARIAREEIHDDGAEKKTFFSIEGVLSSGEHLPKISITAEEFTSGAWPTKSWGQRAIVYVNKEAHLRVAIQELSQGVERAVIYKHIGWRNVRDEYVYLHGKGAIGTNGTNPEIVVDLVGSRLSDYTLPEPPIEES